MRLHLTNYTVTVDGNSGHVRYWAEINEWYLTDFLRWRFYHWYDTKVPYKVPGWKKFVVRHIDDHPERMKRLSEWEIKQDVRCHTLSTRSYPIMQVEVTEAQAIQGGLHTWVTP